jgi:exopolysaccharide production protein ExoQ
MLMRSPGMARTRSATQAQPPGPLIDKWSFVPITAFAFTTTGQLIGYLTASGNESDFGSNLLNQLAWPTMAAAAIGVAMLNSSRLGRLTQPAPMFWLFVCLALALVSTAWSAKPAFTFIRSVQQAMIIACVAVTPMLAPARSADLMRTLFYCCAVCVVLNWLIGTGGYNGDPASGSGYRGFMSSKNNLGQFAAIALLLAVYEITQRGSRRVPGLIIAALSYGLLLRASSKTSTALVYLSPALAGLLLVLKKNARISAVTLLSILMVSCVIFKSQLGESLFHDPTYTGRTSIWEFVGTEIDRRPLLGWGYLAFWLTGPDSPAMVDGASFGWVRAMPHAHNGYVDIVLQLGYVGFACLIMLISTTILAAERAAKRDPARSWLHLSIIIFIMFNNQLESSWWHGSDFLWLVFVMICADIGHHSILPKPASVAQRSSPPPRPAGPRRGVPLNRGPVGARAAIAARRLHAQ